VDELDEVLDQRITELLSGEPQKGAAETSSPLAAYEQLSAEVARVFVETSPRLANAVQARQLADLRARALQKRAARRFRVLRILAAIPRWAQIAVIALVVVLLANGITGAAAGSLPGSPLYFFKRFAEQSNVLLTPTASDRARAWMNLASVRLDEAQRLVANKQRVDPATLDAVDQSILNALSEIAATRGPQRVALLQAITQLAIRQQSILDQLAAEALPADRQRLEQTARLLNGIAALAGTVPPDSGSAPTPATPTPTESATPTLVPTGTPPASPSLLPVRIIGATESSPQESPEKGSTAGPSGEEVKTPSGQPQASPQPQSTEPPEGQKTGTSESQKQGTSDAEKKQSPEPQPSQKPDSGKDGDTGTSGD
jgi:Domain of unknown function (DUF5667)